MSHLPHLLHLPAGLLLSALMLLVSGCAETEDSRFASPVTTFKTRQEALAARDLKLLWNCYSNSYKNSAYGNEFATWTREWQQMSPDVFKTELRREIVEEREINNRIGYLLFDVSTLSSPQSSPFFYFIREDDGWKLTTHLDSVFHQELERAIANGEFELPDE